jgi:hypothetical protein
MVTAEITCSVMVALTTSLTGDENDMSLTIALNVKVAPVWAVYTTAVDAVAAFSAPSINVCAAWS